MISLLHWILVYFWISSKSSRKIAFLRWPDSRESIRRFARIAWFLWIVAGLPNWTPFLRITFRGAENCKSQVWGDSRESLARSENWGFSAHRFVRIDSRESPRFALRIAGPSKLLSSEKFFGWHLVGVWTGGVWNGHFPESEKYFSEAEFSRKIPEIPQKEWYLPNFRLRNLKIQSPTKCNSIPQPFHTPTRLPPSFRKFLPSGFLPLSRFQGTPLI